MVEQASGRGDEDVDAAPERIDLRVDADAAENHGGFQRQVAAIDTETLLDLRGQLSGRGQHQRTDFRARGGLCRQQLHDRQREAGGLAGAGLGADDDVAALQHRRYRLRLDGGGLRVTFVGYSARELGAKAERFE
jgi:hypothetical protein